MTTEMPPGTGVDNDAGDELLTPAEVAALFRVDPKTVTRWATAGKIPSLRTLGGHRRYRATEVYALLDGLRNNGHQCPETPADAHTERRAD